MARSKGSKNRNYPPLSLDDALRMARCIQDEATGWDAVSRLNAGGAASGFAEFQQLPLPRSSRLYGLTTGGINADEFGLTTLGEQATGPDEVEQGAGTAVLAIEPYRLFFEKFKNKKVPSAAAFREFLVKNADVADDKADECMQLILADGSAAGIIRQGSRRRLELTRRRATQPNVIS